VNKKNGRYRKAEKGKPNKLRSPKEKA